AGSGPLIAQTLTNATASAINVLYSITPQAGGCNGPLINVIVTVNPKPLAPVVTGASRCGSGSVTLAGTPGAYGNTLRWYIDSSTTDVLFTGLSYDSPTIFSTTNYYVSSYDNTTQCESANPRIVVTATVNPPEESPTPPTAPTIAGNERFGPGSFSLVASGGETYSWYNPSNAMVSNDALYNTPTVTATTTNYAYAKTTLNSCVSLPSWVTVNVYPDVLITATSDAVFLNENVTLDAGFDYATFDWRNGGASLGSSRYLVTNIPGNYRVSVSYGNISTTSPVFVLHDQLGGLNDNYIVSNNIQIPIQDAAIIKDLPIGVNSQSIQYFDGLGRPKQTVATQGSPAKKDIIQPVAYDQYGRESKKYSPFVSSGNNGRINSDPLGLSTTYANSPQFAFYNNGNADKIADDASPFTEILFEASPLNRPFKQGSPGTDWQPVDSDPYSINDHTVKMRYELNYANDIILFSYDPVSELISADDGGSIKYYGPAQLVANRTYDEANNQVVEYVDKEGRTVCKRVQYAGDVVNQVFASTYYIYDDFGNLVVVLPPEAVASALTQLIQN
ncbi:MAG: DUF6443 domain-containing protein, partial [Cyclobacteriaceae bacterium]